MNNLSIIPLFKEAVKKYGNKEALRTKNKNEEYYSITYNDLNHEIDKLSSFLFDIGIKKNDKVALLSPNCPEWVIADLAILNCGAVNVPIHHVLNIAQIKYILNDSHAKLLIVGNRNMADKILSVENELNYITHMILINDDYDDYNGKLKIIKMNEITENGYTSNVTCSQNESDIVSIVYTSGTTGDPKGVMLTNKNIASNALTIGRILNVDSEFIELSYLPLSHIFERTFYYLLIFNGATIVYAESMDKLLQNMQEVKPNFFVTAPRLLEKIFNRINSNASIKLKDILGDLELIISGSAPLKEEIGEYFHSNGINICEGYGLTEASPVVAVNPPCNIRFGTVGPAITDIEVKIAEDGEILCKGPNVMKGYYNKDKETEEAIDEAGWLHTGDIGYLDEKGYLVINDRKKDIIVMSNGLKVSPQKIENILKDSQYIEQAVIIGNSRPFITALIVPDRDAVKKYADQNDIKYGSYDDLLASEYINKLISYNIDELTLTLAPYEQIKKIKLIAAELSVNNDELTPTLKYKRKFIDSRYHDFIEMMYSKS